ncbi:hypothetical protein C8Q76DRAFT_801771 [Earliella scabrosa]|nr:hypothetical protein C8Q76DRAFT_801771 [Earliella scabrosa]
MRRQSGIRPVGPEFVWASAMHRNTQTTNQCHILSVGSLVYDDQELPGHQSVPHSEDLFPNCRSSSEIEHILELLTDGTVLLQAGLVSFVAPYTLRDIQLTEGPHFDKCDAQQCKPPCLTCLTITPMATSTTSLERGRISTSTELIVPLGFFMEIGRAPNSTTGPETPQPAAGGRTSTEPPPLPNPAGRLVHVARLLYALHKPPLVQRVQLLGQLYELFVQQNEWRVKKQSAREAALQAALASAPPSSLLAQQLDALHKLSVCQNGRQGKKEGLREEEYTTLRGR